MISVCRRRGKQTGTSINVSTLTVVKPNNTFQNMPCFAPWQNLFLLLLLWHKLCFCAGKFLLGRNLNQIVFHKKTRPCSLLWRQPLMMITVTIGKIPVITGLVWLYFSSQNNGCDFEISSVVSACQDLPECCGSCRHPFVYSATFDAIWEKMIVWFLLIVLYSTPPCPASLPSLNRQNAEAS